MPKTLKAGDPFFRGEDRQIAYLIMDVDYDTKTADLKTTAGSAVVLHDVAWSELTLLTDAENATRILREGDEN
jgi:hypothetical protein